jgi:hypothetical protein
MTITTVQSENDVRGILTLQQRNLKRNLSSEQIKSQGFVTVEHQFETLLKMNQAEPSVIVKDGDEVVAYCLTMLPAFGKEVPELVAMFDLLDTLSFKQKSLKDYDYYVMGQVCVGEGYRSQGLFDGMYLHQKEVLKDKFQLCITEISRSNTRSLKAHDRVGFKEISDYYDPNYDETWVVVAWEF